jgi:hypothetical protein
MTIYGRKISGLLAHFFTGLIIFISVWSWANNFEDADSTHSIPKATWVAIIAGVASLASFIASLVICILWQVYTRWQILALVWPYLIVVFGVPVITGLFNGKVMAAWLCWLLTITFGNWLGIVLASGLRARRNT